MFDPGFLARLFCKPIALTIMCLLFSPQVQIPLWQALVPGTAPVCVSGAAPGPITVAPAPIVVGSNGSRPRVSADSGPRLQASASAGSRQLLLSLRLSALATPGPVRWPEPAPGSVAVALNHDPVDCCCGGT